jgi:predicted negative regulator of RcsB-dependent stress response
LKEIDLETDEQRIEYIIAWLKKHLKLIVLLLVLSIVAMIAVKSWQQSFQTQREKFSVDLSSVMDASDAALLAADTAQETQRTTVKTLGEKLIQEADGHIYAELGRLQLVKVAMDQNDLKKAEEHLRLLLKQQPHSSVVALATDRLVRLLADQSRFDEALGVLESYKGKLSQAKFAELKGDIKLAQGHRVDALAAYEVAKTALGSAFEKNMLLKMKMDDLADAKK